MDAVPAVLSVLLAGLCGYAAVRKLSHRPDVVRAYARAGVPEPWLNPLAGVLLAGAAALLAGLLWAPAGIAAAAAFVAYFAVAVGFHVRERDFAALPTPVVMALLAAAIVATAAAG